LHRHGEKAGHGEHQRDRLHVTTYFLRTSTRPNPFETNDLYRRSRMCSTGATDRQAR
jgi:hypothetical protein